MLNKFLKLSTTLLTLGLFSSNMIFAASSMTEDQSLKLQGLITYLEQKVPGSIKTASEFANTLRDRDTTIGNVGEVNLSAMDGLGVNPPVVAFGLFNLGESRLSTLPPTFAAETTLYDGATNAPKYSMILYQITDGTTGIKGTDGKYIIVMLDHGVVSTTNVKESLTFPSSKTKCFTNISSAREYADYIGDNSVLGSNKTAQFVDAEDGLDLKNVTPYLANCTMVDIKVNDGTPALNASDIQPTWTNHGANGAKIASVKITPLSN